MLIQLRIRSFFSIFLPSHRLSQLGLEIYAALTPQLRCNSPIFHMAFALIYFLRPIYILIVTPPFESYVNMT